MEIWDGRTKKQSTRRLNNRNYSILRTERKDFMWYVSTIYIYT